MTNIEDDDFKIANNFISNNEKTFNVLETYYDLLDNLNEDTYQKTINFVKENKNVFFKDHHSGISFFYHTIIASLIHYLNYEIFLDICIEFQSDLKNLKISDSELIQESLSFTNTIYYFYTKNFFSIEAIFEQSFYYNFIFINFLPELKQYDNEYAEIRIKNLLAEQNNQGIIKKDIDFLQFVINNPEKHLLYRNVNYHPSHLHKLIRDDNASEFQSYLSKNNISFNYRFPFSYYERVKSTDKEISLIKCAAIYGSINIFKYLWEKETTKDYDILNYAYCGRNYDIIHICEKDYPLSDSFNETLLIRSKELIEYSFNLYQTEITENNNNNNENNEPFKNLKRNHLHNAVLRSNFDIIKSNLYRILSLAKNDEHINNINFYEDSFLLSSLYNFDLFKLIYSQRNTNIIINQCGCFINCLVSSLRTKKNDIFIFLFNDLYDYINFIFIFQTAIETNFEMANYILDLQIEAKNSNNLTNNIIFTNINPKITFQDLKLAIKYYNEDVIIKMIKLYDLFKLSENIFNFVTELSNNISKKMMTSLFNQLSSFLDRNLLICFSALLRNEGYLSISNNIMNNIQRNEIK